jgi:hypothetical protein
VEGNRLREPGVGLPLLKPTTPQVGRLFEGQMPNAFDMERVGKGIAHRLMISDETVTGAKLADEFRLANDQQVREAIHFARCQRDPNVSRIAASSVGYFWAASKEDGLPTILGLRGRAFSMLDAASGMAHAYGIFNLDQCELQI